MALQAKSLFLYGFTVTSANQNVPFQNVNAGPQINAVIPTGFYTLQTLATNMAAAMNAADPTNVYTVTVNRAISGGTQNRVTIATSGSFLSVLFSSGTTAGSSIASTIGFTATDLTGATSYTNSTTSGTSLQPAWWGFNYQSPLTYQQNIGNVSISASGVKEEVSWSIQQFLKVEFRYEAQAAVYANWNPLFVWMIQAKPFEFIPEISNPSVFYSCSLEKSAQDGKGLGFLMKEMLPDFPFLYTTQPLEFRLVSGSY